MSPRVITGSVKEESDHEVSELGRDLPHPIHNFRFPIRLQPGDLLIGARLLALEGGELSLHSLNLLLPLLKVLHDLLVTHENVGNPGLNRQDLSLNLVQGGGQVLELGLGKDENGK